MNNTVCETGEVSIPKDDSTLDAITLISNECSICYEDIKHTNNCTTPCGHTFCFNCMVKALKSNTSCPLCRTELDYDSETEGTGNEDEDEDDITYISSSDDSSEDDDEYGVEVECMVEEFTKSGYDIKDAISMLLSKYSKTDAKYTTEYITKLEYDFEEGYNRLFMEKRENRLMGEEDVRV